jgi:hypothetical protein
MAEHVQQERKSLEASGSSGIVEISPLPDLILLEVGFSRRNRNRRNP